MVRKNILKRLSCIGSAVILMLAAVPVVPSGAAFADEGNCASDETTLNQLLGDTAVASFAFCGNIAKTLNLTRNVEIDLAGYTLTGKVVIYEGNTVTLKNGSIAGTTINDNIISNKGTLTLENMNIAANTYPVVNSNNGGTTRINGGTYQTSGTYVLAAKSGGTTIVESGDFAGGLYGDLTINGGKFTVDPTNYVSTGKDAYAFNGYWLVGEEASLSANDATVPVGTKVEVARVAPADYNVLDYDIKNSAGADASASVEMSEEIDDVTGEIVVYATGLAQGRKEIDITNNTGLSGHSTLRVYEFQGVEDQVIFKGESLPMEIASNKWNINWALTNSSNESVATVSGDTVTAVGSGKTTVTATFNDTVESKVTFDVYVYDFDETDADTILIKKGKTATVNTDSSWDVEGTTSSQNVQLIDQHGTYSVKGLDTGDAELTFSMTVNGQNFSKTVKAYVYDVVQKDVILEKGATLDENDINGIIDKGSNDVSITFRKFSTEGIASNDGITVTGEDAGDTEVLYRLSVDGKKANVKFNLHVYQFVTENVADNYDLGNEQTVTEAFEVYDNNGTISYSVKNEAGEDADDVVIENNDNQYTIRLVDGATPGVYTVKFVDTVLGQEVDSKEIMVRVHQINTTGEDTQYIVMTRNPFNADENRYDLNVTEASGFTRNRNITATITNSSSLLNGVTVVYRHGGNWRITANTAGSYEIKFSDGVASKTINVYVMQFTFGQDSYHVKRGSEDLLINAINNYWHDINVDEGYVDTEFSVVNDETGAIVATGFDVSKKIMNTSANGEDYKFELCDTDGCLPAGNYTIEFKAYANRGDTHGGKTATKKVRLHVYEMVAPEWDLYFMETGGNLTINVSDLNDQASTRARIVSGPEGGLRFATSGWGWFARTDYGRLIASRPGVYTVEYTDYMGNGAVVGTYTATIVVLEVEEEELFVRRGEKVVLTGSEDWNASFATDDLTGEDYEAEDGEIEFDTTGMDLGEHYVYIAHDFSEFDDGEFPPRELVKVTNVVVYDVVGDENDDMEDDEDRTAVADFVAGKIAETLENDSMDNDMIDWSIDVDELKSYLRDGVEIETRLEVYLMDESEWEYAEAYDEVMLKIEDENGIVAIYEAFLGIYADGTQIGLIYELDAPITMRLLIPEEYRNAEDGYERTFSIIRGHLAMDATETAEGLDVTRDGDYLVFENAKFSSFTITYEDTLIPVAPDTGFVVSERRSAVDNSLIMAIATAITAFTLAGATVFAKRK